MSDLDRVAMPHNSPLRRGELINSEDWNLGVGVDPDGASAEFEHGGEA
jgi:hypothetical protein